MMTRTCWSLLYLDVDVYGGKQFLRKPRRPDGLKSETRNVLLGNASGTRTFTGQAMVSPRPLNTANISYTTYTNSLSLVSYQYLCRQFPHALTEVLPHGQMLQSLSIATVTRYFSQAAGGGLCLHTQRAASEQDLTTKYDRSENSK